MHYVCMYVCMYIKEEERIIIQIPHILILGYTHYEREIEREMRIRDRETKRVAHAYIHYLD